MLEIVIPKRQYLNEMTSEFISVPEHRLTLEHSLISVSKWESKWKKPFFGKTKNDTRTVEESIDYVRCMCLGKEPDKTVLMGITPIELKKINDYIDDPMTATIINDKKQAGKGGRGSYLTSELIYYYMISFEIPFECQKWHLNRLLTLIKICEQKNQPGKKMSKRDLNAQYRAMNEANKRRFNSKG